jgi:hypothetical protein
VLGPWSQGETAFSPSHLIIGPRGKIKRQVYRPLIRFRSFAAIFGKKLVRSKGVRVRVSQIRARIRPALAAGDLLREVRNLRGQGDLERFAPARNSIADGTNSIRVVAAGNQP